MRDDPHSFARQAATYAPELRKLSVITLYTRIKLRTYGATPTTLQHSTDTARSHAGVETLRAASSARTTIGTMSTDHRKLGAAR